MKLPKPKAKLLELYEMLNTPYPIGSREIRVIFDCSAPSARTYLFEMQLWLAKTDGKAPDFRHVYRDQFLRCMQEQFGGNWSWQAIKAEALDLIKAQYNYKETERC